MTATEGSAPINPRLIDQHMRVVIPKEAVDALRIKQGDHVAFVVEGREVRVRKIKMVLDY